MLDYSFSHAKTSTMIRISALNGKNVNKILPACLATYENWNKKISTSNVNKWLEYATTRNVPPLNGGRRVKFKYAKQSKTKPPTFDIFTSSSLKGFPDSYTRYLKNTLREEFGFDGVPVRVNLIKTKNPYVDSPDDEES